MHVCACESDDVEVTGERCDTDGDEEMDMPGCVRSLHSLPARVPFVCKVVLWPGRLVRDWHSLVPVPLLKSWLG